jgi:hypothetical protein
MIVNKNGTGLYENNYLINREIKNCCQNSNGNGSVHLQV